MEIKDFIRDKILELKDIKLPRGKSIEDVVSLIELGSKLSGWSEKAARSFVKQIPEISNSEFKNTSYLNRFLKHYEIYLCTWCRSLKPINDLKCKDRSMCKKCRSIQVLSTRDPVKHKEYSEAYRKKNREKLRAYYTNNKSYYITKTIKRRSLLKEVTPKWANLNKIKEIYANCPQGYHVDHIVPLNNPIVCGLHVEYNLQHLPALENLEKHNKLLPHLEYPEKYNEHLTY